MIKTALKTLLITCLSGTYAQAQPGCTDPQALNFDPLATQNDGSCTYPATVYFPTEIPGLPGFMEEASGLEFFGQQLWAQEDGGSDVALYTLDTLTGAVQQSYPLPSLINQDWEDLAEDATHLYIGDFGNNAGDRNDLRIFKINKNDLLAGTPTAEVIYFMFSDQTDFTPAYNATNHDCEAFVALGDSIHIFSKRWLDNSTHRYLLPTTPGGHLAQLRDSFDVDGLVTAADVAADGKLLLLGYDGTTSETFLWLLFDYPGTGVFGGNKRRISLGTALNMSQAEGLAFSTPTEGFICSEAISFLPQRLFRFDIGQWTENPSATGQPPGEAVFQASPNPFGDFLSIDFQRVGPVETAVELLDLNGKILKKSRLTGPQLTLNTADLPAGIYVLKIKNGHEVFLKKLVKG